MNLNLLKNDPRKVNDGIWIDGPDGSRFLIRSTDHKQYIATLARLARKEGNKARTNSEVQRRLGIEALATCILMDWTGVDSDGIPLEPTVENKKSVLEITEIRELISVEAQDYANFRQEALAADAAEVKSDG